MAKFDLGEFLASSGVNLDTGREQIQYISIDLIVPDPNNFYELSNLDDLAANIQLCGLQQPLRVRPMPGDESQVIILSGHRRHAALRKLVEDGEERFRDVPCIVERGEENPNLTQLKLIYANASTRVLSASELGRQAEQVEHLLYQLKEDGMEFPGRMRDHVAQACKVSTGKLARLKVIRSKLIPQLLRLWESDKLSEGVAYALAGQTPARQKAIYLARTQEGKAPFIGHESWVRNIIQEMDEVEKVCKSTTCETSSDTKCDHKYIRIDRAAALSAYASMSCRGCCKSCYNLTSCTYSCWRVAKERQAAKDKQKAQRREEQAAKAAEEAPKKALISSTYQRVAQRRQALDVTAETFTKTSTGWMNKTDVDKLARLERGEKIAVNERLPGGIWPDEATRLCQVADLLDCSIDWLLGRTEEPKPAPAAPAAPGWLTGTPAAPGWFITRVEVDGVETPLYRRRWFGGKTWAGLTEIETVTHYIPVVPDDETGGVKQ